jgi:hypothetical protein
MCTYFHVFSAPTYSDPRQVICLLDVYNICVSFFENGELEISCKECKYEYNSLVYQILGDLCEWRIEISAEESRCWSLHAAHEKK